MLHFLAAPRLGAGGHVHEQVTTMRVRFTFEAHFGIDQTSHLLLERLGISFSRPPSDPGDPAYEFVELCAQAEVPTPSRSRQSLARTQPGMEP